MRAGVVVGEGGSAGPRPYPAYLAGQEECVEMGDWAVADCEEVRTPWLALSGPRTVFILNENFFSLATTACVILVGREDDENDLVPRLYGD